MKCWDEHLGEILEFAAALRSVVEGDHLNGVPLAATVGMAPPQLLLRGGKLAASECRGIAPLRDLAWQLAWVRETERIIRHPGGPDLRKLEGRVVIEVAGVQDRVRKLWEPLASSYGPKECVLLVPNVQVRNQLPPEFSTVAFSEIPGDWLGTRLWVLLRAARWLRRLRRVCGDFGLADAASWRLAGFLISRAAMLSRALWLVRRVKPMAIIVPYDLAGSGVVLCAAAKTCGIPGVSLVHGAFGRQNAPMFTPLHADFVAVWGEVQAGLFAEAGVSEDRIWNCGVFRDRTLRGRKTSEGNDSLLKKIGLSERKPVVVVGLTCLTDSERAPWIELLVHLSEGLPGAGIVARLHPSNSVSGFVETAGLWMPENLRFVDDSMLSAEESLELADAVVVDSSGFGMDAIERGIPVVVVAPPGGSDYLAPMLEAVEAGAARYAKDAGQAVEILRSLLLERNGGEDLKRKAEAFLGRYYCAFGEDAVARFKEALARVTRAGTRIGE